MYEAISNVISFIDSEIAWGPVVCWFLVGIGVMLTILLRGLPWRNLGWALKSAFSRQKTHEKEGHEGDITPFQSLMTALSATIGTGNIAGVAGAMAIGGPGALVWMWIAAVFGLSTKYSESMIGVKYRQRNERGEMAGGPMYAMKYGIGAKFKRLGAALAVIFSVLAVGASFGIGNISQANTIAESINTTLVKGSDTVQFLGNDVGIAFIIIGVIITVLCLVVLLGGIKRIGRVTGILVPVMAVFYTIGGIICICCNAQNLPHGLYMIFTQAFSTQAVAGGAAGMVMQLAIQKGISRGVFSNESGLGSAPIAAAAAKTDHHSRQGYINMTGTFLDTIIVCSITGLTIAASGLLETTDLTGVNLTIAAFESGIGPIGGYIVTIGIMLFAFSTILGWEYYGERSLEYLAKSYRVNIIYRIIFSVIAFFGCTLTSTLVWDISDIMNGFMAIPNLICLAMLCLIIRKDTFDFQNIIKQEKAAAKVLRKQKKQQKAAA